MDDFSQHDKLRYTIRRKGSRYNIHGPEGRIFTKYKSASVAGPRWEELTHTPWPYPSSAYAPGTRLWQLGLIAREDVGKTSQTPSLLSRPAPRPRQETESAPDELNSTHPEPTPPPVRKTPLPPPTKAIQQPLPMQPAPKTKPTRQKPSARRKKAVQKSLPFEESPPAPRQRKKPVKPATITLPDLSVLALPAPRIDLDEQNRLIQALRRSPNLIFDAKIRDALVREVEYHRPFARIAQTLLKMLERYELRQRRAQSPTDSQAILAKHIAWQEEQAKSSR